MRASRSLQPLSLFAAAAAWCLLGACGRTGLDDYLLTSAANASGGADAGEDASADADAGMDAETEGEAADVAQSGPVVTPPADPCADKPPIPCPGGGFKYCVAGGYSDCPTRCGVCIPGSRRVCILAYCNFWGTQTCTADGLSFGYCVEQTPPPECEAVAEDHHGSSALEQCCLDHGYCCKDEFDLNHNGDTSEQIGQCGNVTCQ